VNIGPALEAHPQSMELMQPRQRAFDDPAGRFLPAAMWSVASRELRLDVARAQCRTVGFGVIGAVALHALGSMAGATTPSAAHGCDAIDQGVGVGLFDRASKHFRQLSRSTCQPGEAGEWCVQERQVRLNCSTVTTSNAWPCKLSPSKNTAEIYGKCPILQESCTRCTVNVRPS